MKISACSKYIFQKRLTDYLCVCFLKYMARFLIKKSAVKSKDNLRIETIIKLGMFF